MKFEEVLPLMREGKKARIKNKNRDDSWFDGDWIMTFNYMPWDASSWMTLTCVSDKNEYSWSIPCWIVASDEWEIVEDEEIKL